MKNLSSFFEFITNENLWINTEIFGRNKLVNHQEPFIYVVLEGAVIITTKINEQEQIIRFGYKNSIISKIDFLLNNETSIYEMKAIKKTKLLYTSKELVLQKIKEKNKYELWISVLENLILQHSEREIDLLHFSANERFNRLLKRSPKVFQEIPNKYIASYLRISPETLSRLLKS